MSDDGLGQVPAGGAGADTGAVDGASIDPDDRAEIQNISSQNDIPGVGTRAGDGSMETDLDESRLEEGPESSGTSAKAATRGVADDSRVTDAATADDIPVEAYEPGVDPDSSGSSRLVGDE